MICYEETISDKLSVFFVVLAVVVVVVVDIVAVSGDGGGDGGVVVVDIFVLVVVFIIKELQLALYCRTTSQPLLSLSSLTLTMISKSAIHY